MPAKPMARQVRVCCAVVCRYLFPAGVDRDGGLVMQRSAEPVSEAVSAASDATTNMPSEARGHGRNPCERPSWESQHQGNEQGLHSTHTLLASQHMPDDMDGAG